MIEIRGVAGGGAGAWARRREERLRAWFGRFDVDPAWVEFQVRADMADRGTVSAYSLFDGDAQVGSLILSIRQAGGRTAARIADLFVEPAHRRRGVATDAVAWAVQQVRRVAGDGVAMLRAATDPADAASEALFAAWPVRSQTMIKRIVEPPTLPAGMTGQAMTGAEFAGWYSAMVRGYAGDLADSGSLSRQDAMAESERETADLLPAGLQTPNHTFWVVTAAPAGGPAIPVATNWLHHHNAPGATWVYAVETVEGHRGHGYGRAAMLVGERATLDAGDTHVALNVFGHNYVAINLYTSMGYATVDRHRSIDVSPGSGA